MRYLFFGYSFEPKPANNCCCARVAAIFCLGVFPEVKTKIRLSFGEVGSPNLIGLKIIIRIDLESS
jgi:hypothetical protein